MYNKQKADSCLEHNSFFAPGNHSLLITLTSSAVITSFANKSYLKHSPSLDLKYCGKIMVYLSAS